MAHRNLTRSFLEKRQAYNSSRSNSIRHPVHNHPQRLAIRSRVNRYVAGDMTVESFNEPLLLASSSSETPIGKAPTTLPTSAPIWTLCVAEIHTKLNHLTLKLEFLTKVSRRRLLVHFDEAKMTSDDQEIESIKNECINLFRDTEKNLKRLVAGFPYTSEADLKVRRNIQHALARTLEKKSQSFRRLRSEYGATKESQEKTLVWEEAAFGKADDQLVLVKDAMELMAEERDGEIQRLTRGLQGLADVFKEVASMVIDQGTIIDRIDYNMEQVVVRMSSGMKELMRAEEYQKNNRASTCIILLLFLISMCFLTLMSRHS